MALESHAHEAKVLCFGEPIISLAPDSAGVISTVHQFRPYPAGAELNTAVGLARLGVQSAMAGCVGADPFGDLLKSAARAEGVDVTCLESSAKAPTAVLFKQWAGLRGDTSVYYYRATSPMAAGHWQGTAAAEGLDAQHWDWVHATGITWMIGQASRDTAMNLVRMAHQNGIPFSFDVNVRLKLSGKDGWQQLVQDVLPYVTWFLVGDEEAMLLFDTDCATELEAKLRSLGFNGIGVVVKRGAKGVALSAAGEETEVPVWPVDRVVDTVGAGDGFNAGFIAGLLKGENTVDALRLGTLVGAFAVTSVGDYQGYPAWHEVVQEMSGNGSAHR